MNTKPDPDEVSLPAYKTGEGIGASSDTMEADEGHHSDAQRSAESSDDIRVHRSPTPESRQLPPPQSPHSRVTVGHADHKGARHVSITLSDTTVKGDGQSLDVSLEEDLYGTMSSGGQFDFEKGTRAWLEKQHEAGIKARELGVLFEGLHVVGLGASASFQPTFGAVFNPMNFIRKVQASRRPPPLRDILTDFEGVVRPGEMLLVLGRPGAGCTTLLKILANQREEYHSISGDVHYHSLTPSQVQKHYRGDIQYCPENDTLFPTLTVDETVHFAAQARAPQSRIENQTRKQYTRLITDMYTTVFGLAHRRKTLVGDAAIRGVSGGEKKRVAISETLASRSLITSWDNPTRGLDSSTALEFARALRTTTQVNRISTIAAIYQAGEPLYEMFDKVCVLYEGRMVYFGPASSARQYFTDMGYQPASRQTTPDFLVSVTDPQGCTERSPLKAMEEQGGVGKPIPRTALEFAEYYKKSSIRRQNIKDMEDYKASFVGKKDLEKSYKESSDAEHSRHTSRESPFITSVPMQVRIVMKRRMQIIKGNYTAQALSTVAYVLEAVIIGTMFISVSDSTAGFFSRGGVFFPAVFAPTLFATSEIPSLFAQRPIVKKQAQAAMYHPMIEALAVTLVDIPFTLVSVILYTVIIYFAVGLQASASQFFTFFLFILTVALSMKALFRALAAAAPHEAPALALGGVLLLIMSMYIGYPIPRPSMIGALRWLSYINPIFYGFSSLMSSEFHTLQGSCASLVPSGPGYENVSIANQVCPVVGAQPGQLEVNGESYVGLSFGYHFSDLWRNYGILCAFGVFFVLCFLFFTESNPGVLGSTTVIKFKLGSKSDLVQEATPLDEEKGATNGRPPAPTWDEKDIEKKQLTLAEKPGTANTFSWHHVDYVISKNGVKQKLLDDVSGYVSPGKLTALMGESGAGKTTLLNVLAQRVDTGVIAGDRFFNGQPLPPDFQMQTGYCQQMDTHEPMSTVREALRFSARLRQPSSVPVEEKDAYADRVLEICGLSSFADAIVGSLGVEEGKRLTIGVELAAKPKLLLFLDEPTSGLDSQSAWAIVSFLKQLADSGQAILCTIHQPSAELFGVFDRLLLLRKGGQTVYFGDIGKDGTSVIEYFEAGGGRTCKPGENPAEYMLEVVGAGATAVADRDWYQIWRKSETRRQLDKDLERVLAEGKKLPPVEQTLRGNYAMPWLFQAQTLLERQFLSFWRTPEYVISKLVLCILGALLVGFTFFKSGDTIQDTQNKLFAVYMALVLSAPLGEQAQPPFIHMRSIYEIREGPSRIYHWSALTTAQLLSEVPWNILGATLSFLCWYWTVGFASSRGGFTYLVYGIQFPLCWTTVALAVASMSPTAEIAGLLYSFLVTFILTFNGALQPYRLLGWWQWMYRVSPYSYLLESMLGQAIGHMEINCSATELVSLNPPSGQTCGSYLQEFISRSGGYVTNPGALSGCLFCSARTTDEWMGPTFNVFYDHHWRNFGISWVYIVFNTFLVYLLTYLIRVKSHKGLLGSFKKMFS